jgi:sugar lactone lactonase YvrE
MKARLVVLALVLALSLAVAAVTGATAGSGGRHGEGSGEHGGRIELPDRLDLPAGWQPEGIASGRRGWDLFVGSIPTGAVLRLDARTGESTTVVGAHEGRAAIGLKLDDRQRLFVAGGPTGKAFVYDARTGEDLAELQLSVPGADTFVNDVALARSTAYFTDSRRSALYAVDPDLHGARTIALPDIPNEDGFNLNGIVATPDERSLLAVQTTAGRLWKIDPSTGAAVQVDLGGTALTNGDGLLLRGRTLYVVQNADNQVAVVRLSADYTSGSIVTTIKSAGFDFPTTIAKLHGELYAVNARFLTTDPQPAAYWVTLVRR